MADGQFQRVDRGRLRRAERGRLLHGPDAVRRLLKDQIDVLTGSAGNDWYIYQTGEDRTTSVNTLEAAEVVTEL